MKDRTFLVIVILLFFMALGVFIVILEEGQNKTYTSETYTTEEYVFNTHEDDRKDISEKYIYNGTENGTENNNDNDTESTANFVVVPCIVPGWVNVGSGVCITTDKA